MVNGVAIKIKKISSLKDLKDLSNGDSELQDVQDEQLKQPEDKPQTSGESDFEKAKGSSKPELQPKNEDVGEYESPIEEMMRVARAGSIKRDPSHFMGASLPDEDGYEDEMESDKLESLRSFMKGLLGLTK